LVYNISLICGYLLETLILMIHQYKVSKHNKYNNQNYQQLDLLLKNNNIKMRKINLIIKIQHLSKIKPINQFLIR
jgi:hypothetical protein